MMFKCSINFTLSSTFYCIISDTSLFSSMLKVVAFFHCFQKLHHGSISSFPDSGLSDQEAKDVLYNEDRLAKLPGPGKMKQLTNHRCEIDVDSGFVGSVVSNLEGIQNPMQNRKRPSHTKQVER